MSFFLLTNIFILLLLTYSKYFNTVVMEDNNPTVQLSSSLSSRIKRSKHFLINFIRQQVSLGLIEVGKVASADNIADVLTKALPLSEFAPKAARLLGIDAEDMEPQH